ncbi:hypothetical protein LptCag_0372 [Leptospirillum ferriphilum]|uniref:Uncharacterized protein n=1 Tax=Leptospirillum ferriphilum TaxID=178606 RepID=A0A094YJE7_9BACT|nr:hypothetical protein LptCag_0372 [Leptospirillum ferriphilum]
MSLWRKRLASVHLFAFGHLNKYRKDLSSCIGCLGRSAESFSHSLLFAGVSSFYPMPQKPWEKCF